MALTFSSMKLKMFLITLPFMVFGITTAQMAPAMFVFGDSLVDVGNNNYLEFSFLRSNFPPNGIDYPAHKATGRFSNGKNAADFIAERLGIPSPLPYLSLVHSNDSTKFLTGVSFASGGAGILDSRNKVLQQTISMNNQVESFAKVQTQMVQQLGELASMNLFSNALFLVVIGNNDLLGYFNSNSNSTNTTAWDTDHLLDMMIGNLTGQIQRIYDLGARKFEVVGVPPVGCCPSLRRTEPSSVCKAEENQCAAQYNQRLVSLLERFKSELIGFQYSYLGTYDLLLDYIQNPAIYGFKEVKAACCGLGELRAVIPCLSISTYCRNRSDHVFWDFYHPTETTAGLVIRAAFDGPASYSYPVTLTQLLATTT